MAFLSMSTNRVLNRQVRTSSGRAKTARRYRPRREKDRERRRDDRRDRRGDESIGIETGGETIAGDLRGNMTGTVREADVTGGDVMIADRPIHKGCGR